MDRKLEDEFKLTKSGEIRTRFAPSPTGLLHVGTARTALFNYLFAKKYQGRFVLRIEDTDIERSKPWFEKDIIENLKWLGIEWDEGPIAVVQNPAPTSRAGRGQKYIGDYGPYRQSERKDIYRKYLEKLLAEEKAYYCFCREEELEAKKQYQMSIGRPPRYNGECAKLSPKEVKKNLREGKKNVIRFKVPSKLVKFNDLIREEVEFDTNLIGDFVIAKNFDTALYNFTATIDDFEMKITHVIRGEDHLPNTPKQILIQETLGFPHPAYAHLPLILGPDRSKLSKRHGAVAIAEYKKIGYLPEALINFLSFLGWNPGIEREIYSLSSLIKEFSLEKVQKGGAIFNIKKLDFLNGFYIRQKSLEKLTELSIPYLIQEGLITPLFKTEQYPPAYGGLLISQVYKIPKTGKEVKFDDLKKIVTIYQERLKKLSEIAELTDFFFKEKLDYPKELLRWKNMSNEKIQNFLDNLTNLLSKIKDDDWERKFLEKVLTTEAEKIGEGDRGYLLWPLRVALTGKEASAGPFEIAEILGKKKTLKRIEEAKELFKS